MKEQFIANCKCSEATKLCEHIETDTNTCKVTNKSCSSAVVSLASVFKWAENADDPECREEDSRYKNALDMWSKCSKGMLNLWICPC